MILSHKSIIFRPYADRFIQLMRKYVFDRNDTVSASYSSSIGYLVRLATDDQTLKTIEFAKNLYYGAEETTHRAISGEMLYSMSKLANDRIMALGSAFLPFVFVAMHDTDDQVKELFYKTWKDNVSGSRAVTLYLEEILDLVLRHLDSPRWAIKDSSALAVAKVVSSMDGTIDVTIAGLIWPILEKAMARKAWAGKERVLEGLVKFSASTRPFWSTNKEVGDQMKVRNPLPSWACSDCFHSSS